MAKLILAAGQALLVKLGLLNTPRQTDDNKTEEQSPNHMKEHSFTDPETPITAQAITKRYIPLRLLGEGGNGQVHLCSEEERGTLYAVKTIYHSEAPSPPPEARMLDYLGHHKHIARYHATLPHPSENFFVQLVFEYCELGDLADYLDTTMGAAVPETFIWHTLKHVTSGLHFLHSAGVVHGDLKCTNILLTAAKKGGDYPTLKIADFGTARLNPPEDVPFGHYGTKGYQPPEAVKRYGRENDIWALGCIIHEMATERVPQAQFHTRLSTEETDSWFEASGGVVPTGTLGPHVYKSFCHYMALCPAAPKRIDHGRKYSKLLNYFMMRALDTNYRTRITIYELKDSVPVLEKLSHDIHLTGLKYVLNLFDDGTWEPTRVVTDATVFETMFRMMATRALDIQSDELLMACTPLLKLLNPAQRAAATEYVEYILSL